MTAPVLEFREVVKRFGAVNAVDRVSVAVQRGEIFTLLGPSGCGKTTTLRLVAGLEEPEGGEISIDSTLVAAPSRGLLLAPEKRRLGMVFQSYAIWPHLTVFENIAFPLRVRHESAEILRARVEKALDSVGLASLAERGATQLSGGQQKRVALARALVYEPAVLLQNVQNWTVRNLELTQHGQTPQNLDPNNDKGKDADKNSDEYMRAVVHVLGLGPANNANCGEACTVRNIRLENLLVRDGSWTGIYVSGGYYQLDTAKYGFVDNLVISGEGPDRERLERLANGRVRFTGRVSEAELADLYARCRAVFYAPIDEDFGMVPFEAFRCSAARMREK